MPRLVEGFNNSDILAMSINPQSTVTLGGTNHRYTVEAVHCTYPLASEWSQEWARLRKPDGSLAYWLVSQLRVDVTGKG